MLNTFGFILMLFGLAILIKPEILAWILAILLIGSGLSMIGFNKRFNSFIKIRKQ